MRVVLPAVLCGLVLVLAATGADPRAVPTKEQIESDLRLVPIVAEKTRVIEAGTQPRIEFKLVNTSKTHTHKVVKPGDGSEVGWRDPWVHVTAEQRTVEGKWAPMTRPGYGRCGLFDSDWPKDVVELKPGEELKLTEWYAPGQFEFQFPGKVRLVGHYAFRAVGGKGGKERPDAERGKMAGVPLFAVASEPVEFEVVRPLDVKVKVKKPLKVGAESKLSDVIEVTVTNASDAPRTVGNLSQNDYRIGVLLSEELATQPAFQEVPVYSTAKALKPGETATVFGAGEFAGPGDGTWKGLRAGTTQLRVIYSIPTRDGAVGPVIRSADVELRVEP